MCNFCRLLFAEFLRILAPRVTVAGSNGSRTGAADAAIGSICLLAKQQLEFVQLRKSLTGNALRQFGILRAPFGGIEPLCPVDQILILTGELRIARDVRPKLADLANHLIVE